MGKARILPAAPSIDWSGSYRDSTGEDSRLVKLSHSGDMARRIGGHGQSFSDGHFATEHQPDLDTFEDRVEHFDKIRKGVSSVAAALAKIRTPIIQGEHRIEAGEPLPPLPSEEETAEDPFSDLELADASERMVRMLRANLLGERPEYRMGISWRQFIGEMLTALWAGISVHEIVYTHREGPWGEMVAMDRPAWIHPASICAFRFDENDRLLGIEQEFIRTWWDQAAQAERETEETVFIPAEKLIIWAPEPEGANPAGVSLVRPMYGDVKEAVYLRRAQMVHASRTAYAIPYVKFTEQHEGIGDTDKAQAIRTAKRLRGGAAENAFFVSMPGEEIGFLEGGNNTFNPGDMIRARERAIRAVVGAEASGLGQAGEGGSRAVGEVQEVSKFLLVEAIAASLAETIQQRVIEPLYRINFSEDLPIPTFSISDLFPPDPTALKVGVNTGFLSPDEDDEDWYRRRHNLPPKVRDEEEEDDEEEPPEPEEEEEPASPVIPEGDGDDLPPDPSGVPDSDALDGPDDPAVMAEDPLPPERVASKAPAEASIGRELRRPLTDYEKNHVPLAEIDRGFRAGETDFLTAVSRAWQELVSAIAETASPAADNPARLEVDRPEGDDLRQVMESLANRMRERGRETVLKELQSQLLARGVEPERVAEIALAEADIPGTTQALEVLTSSETAERASRHVAVRIELDLDRLLDEAIVGLREGYAIQTTRGLVGEEAIAEATRQLQSSALKERGKVRRIIDSMSKRQASGAFAQGRAEQTAAVRERLPEVSVAVELVRAVRNEVLDDNTCEVCAELDGLEVDIDSEEYWEFMPPAKCQGGDFCRGFYTYPAE